MNLDIYTSEMSKSVWDKAFFMDKIPGVKCVIDFGCADGAMIRYLAPLFPDIYFIGYDINNELIKRGRDAAPFYSNVQFYCKPLYNSLDAFISFTKDKFNPNEICINFSSVLHEVFSSTGGIEDIKKLVSELKPKYITIRDMYCDELLPISEKDKEKVWGPLDSKRTREFETKFGHIETWRDLTHFLMKLQWVDNGWEEEMKENYYSWNIYNFIDTLDDKYILAFECRYQLPYLSEKWWNKFDWYNPDIHTHAQFILRRDN